MGSLSETGYTISTASELEAELLDEATAHVPGFTTGLPSELRTNLITEASLVSLKMENGISNLMNGIAPTFANDFMFQQFAQSFGLGAEKEATLANGTLVFSGSQGDYIPSGLVCTDSTSAIEVTTLTDGIISSGGTASISAESTTSDAILANTITIIQVPITGVTVNNPAAFVAGQPAETAVQYRARVQNTLSAPRIGQIGRAYELIWAIPGVDPRLVFFRRSSITIGPSTFAGIEAIVGGGDDGAVANALFNSFLETKNLTSAPSDSDAGRTIEYNVQVYNSVFPVKFTRPLLSTLAVTLTLDLEGVTSTAEIVSNLLETAFTNYINSLHVGESSNVNSFNKILFDELETLSIYPNNVKDNTYSFSIDGSPVIPASGYLPVEFDQYLELTSFTLNLS